jgi:hypothetical protein
MSEWRPLGSDPEENWPVLLELMADGPVRRYRDRRIHE